MSRLSSEFSLSSRGGADRQSKPGKKYGVSLHDRWLEGMIESVRGDLYFVS
jgi:hypothetical protein